MEIPDLGQQCSSEGCNLLDFLPLKCACDSYFCQNHFFDHAVKCNPLNNNFQITKTAKELLQHCSSVDCKNSRVFVVECKQCHRFFCIQHRYHDGCYELDSSLSERIKKVQTQTNEQFKNAQKIVDQKLDLQLSQAMKKPSSARTANQVNIMRLKGRAKGETNIPVVDRIYFNVYFKNKSDTIDNLPIYVSKTWSVGRAIDSLAKLCSMQNRNNDSTALPLRLFKKDDGQMIANVLSIRVEELISQSIISNGECIVIDYCKDNKMLLSF